MPQAYYENLWPGDLNRDGRIDLVGGAWSPTGVQTWLNDYPMSVEGRENPAIAFAVWPNPASNRVRFTATESGPFSVRLYDATGRPILGKEASGHCDLDVAGLLPGVYIYTLKQAEKVHAGRLTITR